MKRLKHRHLAEIKIFMMGLILSLKSSVIFHCSFYAISHIAKFNTGPENRPAFINKEGVGCREDLLHNNDNSKKIKTLPHEV